MDEAFGKFLQLGVGYVIAAASMIVNLFLFNKLWEKDKVVDNRDIVIGALQEKRVAEAEKRSEIIKEMMNSVVTPIAKVLDAQQAFTRFIENNTWTKK